jgi:hypothetical protein
MTTRVTFSDMERFALNEAARIEVMQAALVRLGDIARPHPDALRNKEICEAIVRLIHTCRADLVIMERFKLLVGEKRIVPDRARAPAGDSRGQQP